MEIEQLNALMFEAEAHRDCEGVPWAEFFGLVLADDFALRRSAASKPREDRDTFLQATRDAQPVERTIVPGSVRVWGSDTVAAVSSRRRAGGTHRAVHQYPSLQRRRYVRLALQVVAGYGCGS
jgi:hypothetical protein